MTPVKRSVPLSELSDHKYRALVEGVKELRAAGLSPQEIWHQVRAAFKYSHQTLTDAIGDADAEMDDFAGRSKLEQLADSVQFWNSIIQDKEGIYSGPQKIDARKQLDKVYGLTDHSKGRPSAVYANFENVTLGAPDEDEQDAIEQILAGKITQEKQ
jgi:hypothetical protein